MKPVHELTTDQAVLELEAVSDQLMERSTPALQARKTELEAWILMHQVQTPTPIETPQEAPMPKPKQTEEEKRAKAREYNREWARKKALSQKTEKVDTSAKRVEEIPKTVQIPVQVAPAKVDQLRAEATIPGSPEALQIALIKRLREIRAQAPRWVSEETILVLQSSDHQALELLRQANQAWGAAMTTYCPRFSTSTNF